MCCNRRCIVDAATFCDALCPAHQTLNREKIQTLTVAAVDFESFQRVLNRPGGFRDPGEPEEYCRGFQVFDKDMTGFIGVGQLKYILTNLGEKMTEDEVDELLKAVDTSSGQVNYTGMLVCADCTLRSCLLTRYYHSDLVRTILAN